MKNSISLALSQFFSAYAAYLSKASQADDVYAKNLQALADTIEEYFVQLEEKAHNLQSESYVLKERLIVKLLYIVLSSFGERICDFKELNHIFAVHLHNYISAKLKCVNSSFSLVDCKLTSPLHLHRHVLPHPLVRQVRVVDAGERDMEQLRSANALRVPRQVPVLLPVRGHRHVCQAR